MIELVLLIPEKRRPCPVCGRFFTRDRDLILCETELGRRYYICQSEIWEDSSCGFGFPECLTEGEVEKEVKKRIDFLSQK